MSGVESYLTEAPRHRPRWYGDVGIVAAALVLIALIASTLSWCDFSLQSYRLTAAVPVLLCPGGANAGQVAEGTTVRVTAVYSGSLGQFRELSTGSTVVGWASASDADAATGVTTSGIFGLKSVTDPAFDGPDCTTRSTTTTVETTEGETTAAETTAPVTTVAGLTTTGRTTIGRTTVPRTTGPRATIRPTIATTATTATTLPTTTTAPDTKGPDLGPVRLSPSTISEQPLPSAAAACGSGPTISVLSVSVSDPSGVKSVTYDVAVKGLEESGVLSNVDEVYSSTVGPFANVFPANDKATSAVIAVTVTAIDELGNESQAVGSGILLRCAAPATTTTLPSTTTTFVIP